jgi:hypothetical protein
MLTTAIARHIVAEISKPKASTIGANLQVVLEKVNGPSLWPITRLYCGAEGN